MKLLATGLLFLALTPAASAAPVPGSAADAAAVVAATPIAEAAWPDSPCNGQFVVTYDDDLYGVDDLGHTLRANGVATINDGSAPVNCHITLSLGLSDDPVLACTVLVHEAGHLSGIRYHTPGGVMSEYGSYYEPCQRFAPVVPRPRDVAARLVRVKPSACRLVRRWRTAVNHTAYHCLKRRTLFTAQIDTTSIGTIVSSDYWVTGG